MCYFNHRNGCVCHDTSKCAETVCYIEEATVQYIDNIWFYIAVM